MTHIKFLCIVFFCASFSSQAQETIRQQVTTSRTASTHDSTIFLVNGYKTEEPILRFFKPEEISMNPIYDPNNSQLISTLEIQVFDTAHVVLKYLKYKASLDLGEQNFKHGIIPNEIRPYRISSLQYVVSEDRKSDVLVVTLSQQPEDVTEQRVRYRSQTKRIRWYDVDGQVMSQEEMNGLQLKLGEFESGEVISGQQATEKYGDPKYADGVKVIKRVKKEE